MLDAPVGAVPTEERKLVTVLFADVVGFTTLAETADPETVARTVDAAFRRLGEVVAAHGGTVDKYMGDSLMALFGVPAAHDDDAERAVAAGMAMREAGGDLAFSIGINTGEVMVTAVGRDGDVTAIGDTVNVAARLEKVAGPGEVLVGPLTAQLTAEQVEFRRGRPVVVKGRREPVEVCEAVRLHDSAARSALRAGRGPLVGRSEDLAFLRSQWRRAVRDQRAAVVLVTGEAGVGTTRLVEELADEVAGEAHVVRTAYPAYGNLGDPRIAADVVSQLGLAGDAEVDAKVRSATGRLDPGLKQLDPASFQAEQVWAFARLLEAKASERPILMVLDDAHRAGERTMELIDEVVRRSADLPFMFVLVGRPEPSGWLSRLRGATTLRLGPLGADDARRLADVLVGDQPLEEEAARFLVDRSRGNALYLRELVALARERGHLVSRQGRYGLDTSGGIPASLRAVLAARIDALEPREKLALQHVAVLGHASTGEQMEVLGLADADAVLRGLESSDLLRRHGEDGCYDVADPLLGEVAYEMLPLQLRADRHRRAAGAARDAEERARHLVAAARADTADDALRREAALAAAEGGVALLAAFRHQDAVRLLRQAVELGDERADTALELAEALFLLNHNDEALEVLARIDSEGDPVVEARRVHMQASATMLRAPAEALPKFDEAIRRWEELGNLGKLGWGHSNKGVALFSLSRMQEASEALHRGLALFEEVGDQGGKLAVYGFLGLVHPTDPRVPEWLEAYVDHADQMGDRTRLSGALVSLQWHRFLRFRLGGGPDAAEAEATALRLLGLAEELGQVEFGSQGGALAVNLARLGGRFDDAAAVAERLRRLIDPEPPSLLVEAALFDLALAGGESPPVPGPFNSPDPVVNMAVMIASEALMLAGRPDEAIELFASWPDRPDLGPLEQLGPALTRAAADVLAGRHGTAGPSLEQALRAAEATEIVGYGPYVVIIRALLAEVAAVNGDRARAAELLDTLVPTDDLAVSQALLRRAHAQLGDERAAAELEEMVTALRAPGLALS